MKKLFMPTFVLLLLFVSQTLAQQSGGGNYPAGSGVRVKEVDGSPNVPGTQILVFPNGSLTRAGQAVTVTFSGSATNVTVTTTTITGGTSGRFLYDNAGAIGETGSGITTDGTNATFGSGNARMTSPRVTTSILDANGNVMIGFNPTGSAVNYLQITNSASSNNVDLAYAGTATNGTLTLSGKGTGGVGIGVTSTTARLDIVSASGTGDIQLKSASGFAAYLTFAGNGGSYNAYIGAVQANGLIVGSSAGDMAVRNNQAINFSANSGSRIQMQLANSGSLYQYDTNGGSWERGVVTELITLSTGGTTTDSSANLLPANSIIEAVTARVTTTISTATDWSLGDATTAARFASANSTLTSGTTSVGLNHYKGGVSTDAAGPVQTSAAKLRITTTGTPSAGAIRVTVYYRTFVGPTS